ERIEAADVLDEGILLARLLFPTERGIEIPEPRRVLRERDDREGLSVKVEGLLRPVLRGPDLREGSQSAVVVRIAREGLEVLDLRRLQVAHREVLDAKLPLRPRDTLGRLAGRAARLDRPAQLRDGAFGITTEAPESR